MMLVSIIIPTFNRAHLLSETIDSIIEQTYENWECIIVDDGSTDDSLFLLKGYQKKDSRIQYYSRPNNLPKGANACRNYGWRLAKGNYLKFFDSDDIMKPNFIAKQVSFLDENPTLDFCASYWELWYKDGSKMKNKPYTDIDYRTNPVKSYLLESHIFPTPSPLWRSSFLEHVEPFNEDLHRGQEADFHFNIMCKSPKYDFVEDFLFLVRVGHQSIKSNAKSFESYLSVYKYFVNVKNKIEDSSNKEKERLLQYVFYRMTIAFYNMVIKEEQANRRSIFKKYYKDLENLSRNKFINKNRRLALGCIVLKYLNKGYTFFYYPKFDHRLKINY